MIDEFWWAYAIDDKRIQPACARRLRRDYLAGCLVSATRRGTTKRPVGRTAIG